MTAPYTSATLFHGPRAEDEAHEYAAQLGRLLHDPFGVDGLKIGESREIIDLMNNTPLGDKPGVIIVGPMDHAWPSATDVLLKTLEEFDPNIFRPVLWAYDEGGVRGTIRSRCLRKWCPGDEVVDDEMLEKVGGLIDASLKRDRAVVLETLKELEGDVLVAAAQVLKSRSMGPGEQGLWERLRQALKYTSPSATEIKVVFL